MRTRKLPSSVTMLFLLALVCSLIWIGQAFADMPVFIETYNIAPPVPCDGMNRNGVGYAFTVGGAPSWDCLAGTGGPGNTNNITFPNIEGNAAGVLHLTFDVPTTKFGFGVAQSTLLTPQPNSVIVHLNRPGVGLLRQEVPLTTTADPYFVGGRYDYDGPAVKTVTIQFSGPYTRFVLDNLTYFRPRGQSK